MDKHSIAVKGGYASGLARQTDKYRQIKADAIRLHTQNDLSVVQIEKELNYNRGGVRRILVNAGVYRIGHREIDWKEVHNRQSDSRALNLIAEEYAREIRIVACLDNRWSPHKLESAFGLYKRLNQMTPQQRAICNRLHGRVYQTIKAKGISKVDRSKNLVGCSVYQLCNHLESTFKDGMAWHNMGRWEIDHVRPCASFDMNDPEDQLACFHWSNLQALWKHDNASKKDKWIPCRIQPTTNVVPRSIERVSMRHLYLSGMHLGKGLIR